LSPPEGRARTRTKVYRVKRLTFLEKVNYMEQIKDVVKLGCSLGNAISKSLADGEFTWTDAVYFIGAVKDIPAAVSGIGEISGELMDMDESEKEELKKFIMDEFDIPGDKTESVIESAVSAVLELLKIMQVLNEQT
jgi:hypothetical protein